MVNNLPRQLVVTDRLKHCWSHGLWETKRLASFLSPKSWLCFPRAGWTRKEVFRTDVVVYPCWKSKMFIVVLSGHTLRLGEKPAVTANTCVTNEKKRGAEREVQTQQTFSLPHS